MTASTDTGRQPEARNNILGAALLLLLVLAAYGPALHAGFIWDDDMFITDNEHLRTLDGLRVIWTEPAKNPHFYPLLMSLFWAMYQLWGVNPAGYHLVTVLCHAGCAILFWRMLLAVGARGAFLAAVIFALHPVHVQSVAWCTELKNTLSGCFYIGALLAWANEDKLGRARSYGLCAFLFAGALLSKTTSVSLPLAILLLEVWRRGKIRAATWGLVLGLVVLAAIPGAVTLGLERSRNVPYVASQFFFPEKLIVTGLSVWFYLGKLLWPHPLIMIYPYWQLDMAKWQQYVPLALVVLSVPALVLARRRLGLAPLFAWLFFIATLAPIPFMDVNFVLQHSFVADHFLYLPSLGIIAVFAAGLATLVHGRLLATHAALAILLAVALGGLTWRQSSHYENQERLWRHTLAYNPKCSVAYNNMGLLILQQGRVDEAIEVMRTGIAQNPSMAKYHSNLALALKQKGDEVGAVEEYSKAIELDSMLYEARLELAALRLERGDLAAALLDVQRAVETRPDAWEAQWNLGLLLAAEGRMEDAIASLRKAAALRKSDHVLSDALSHLLGCRKEGMNALRRLVRGGPSIVIRDAYALQPRILLARALAQVGEVSSAKKLLDDVIRQQADSADALFQLGEVAIDKGDYTRAADRFARALAIKPDSSELMNNLAWLRATAPLDTVRDGKAAVALAERAVARTQRNDPALLDTLAAAYAEAGRYDDAVKTVSEAIDLARRGGQPQFASELESRLGLYRASQPFRDIR